MVHAHKSNHAMTYFLSMIFMYAKTAQNVNIPEKTATLITMFQENKKAGEESRNERIMSDALLSGLTSARVTRNEGNLPVLPRS